MLHIHITVFSYMRGLAINIEWENQAEATTGVTGDEWMDERSRAAPHGERRAVLMPLSHS